MSTAVGTGRTQRMVDEVVADPNLALRNIVIGHSARFTFEELRGRVAMALRDRGIDFQLYPTIIRFPSGGWIRFMFPGEREIQNRGGLRAFIERQQVMNVLCFVDHHVWETER